MKGESRMFMKFMKMMQRKNNNKGFTLVELMVVIVIIGILVAIAVPIYNQSTTNAQVNACKANLRIINGAVSQYAANNNGTYPTTLSQLSSYLTNVSNLRCPTTTTGNYTIDAATHMAVCNATTPHTLP
jgi:type IV pilus assembly protein PilA